MERWYNYHGYIYTKHSRSRHNHLYGNGNRTFGLWYGNRFG